MAIYALTIFVSSFLIFQVQPMIGKYILPWYGSSPGVWTSVFLFFQILLVVGYLYAHLLNRFVSRSRQPVIHLALLASVILLLPITPSDFWKPAGEEDPLSSILLLLAATVGAPYLMLSSTAPLLQAWFARAFPGRSPYRLYAVSNVGSLSALLSYPFLIEPFVRLRNQTLAWSIFYAAFVLLVALCARMRSKSADSDAELLGGSQSIPPSSQLADDRGLAGRTRPVLGIYLVWLTLSALGSVLLMATANRLSQDVPPVPFLFILPLSLYLITFIIAFENPRYYSRKLFGSLLWCGLFIAGVLIYRPTLFNLTTQICLYSFILFVGCMACHGELSGLRPAPEYLTQYFLSISIGGALGGLFVAVLAPMIFTRYWEYEIGLFGTFLVVMAVITWDLTRRIREAKVIALAHGMRLGTIPWESLGNLPTRDADKISENQHLLGRNWILGAGSILLVVAVGTLVRSSILAEYNGVVRRERNFYGCIRVVDSKTRQFRSVARMMGFGPTMHGLQFRDAPRKSIPAAYFGPDSGIGLTLRFHPHRSEKNRPFRFGVIGLGAGILACYANSESLSGHTPDSTNDVVTFLEINPSVISSAKNDFSFLNDARSRGAELQVRLGDARIVLEQLLQQKQPQNFDVLAVDAFTCDAIPLHLLTEECFKIYLQHLQPDGVLALHVTNPFNLLPVVRGSAQSVGMKEYFIRTVGKNDGEVTSQWILVTGNQEFISQPEIQKVISTPPKSERTVHWTDDFHSLFQVLR